MSNLSETETEPLLPTAPPPSELDSPIVAPVTTAPQVALKEYYAYLPQNHHPKGYPVKQIPVVLNQPAAYSQQYQQRHPDDCCACLRFLRCSKCLKFLKCIKCLNCLKCLRCFNCCVLRRSGCDKASDIL